MPFDQVREGQENRGRKMPDSRIYSSGSTGQKIKVTVEAIVILRPSTRTESHSHLMSPTDFADNLTLHLQGNL